MTRTNSSRLTDNNLEINHNSKQLSKGTGYQPYNEVSHTINTGCHSNKYAAFSHMLLALVTFI